MTGIAMRLDGMAGKQFELATEVLSGAKKIGVLVNVASPDATAQLGDVDRASAALKVDRFVVEVRKPDELEAAVQHLAAEHVASIVVLYDALFFQERRRIAALIESARLPAIFGARDHAAAGGLMSYGVSLSNNAYRSAAYIDKIFKGAKPGDLPVEFPTKLELIINLRTAKALDLTIPPQLLARADEVIE